MATDEKKTLDKSVSAVQEEHGGDVDLGAIDFKIVTFSLAGKDYGIDIMNVKEIVETDRFTYVPNTASFVRGVHNLRGDIIPILDLRLFFNIRVAKRADGSNLENLIILTVGENTFGVVVDDIDKVVGVQKNKISPPHPLFGDINIKYISGVVEANESLYVLLDIDKIFNSHVGDNEKQNAIGQSISPMPDIQMPIPAMQAAPAAGPDSEQEIKFIAEGLANYRHFHVSFLNEQWVRNRYVSWQQERGRGNTQLQSEQDADAFLGSFWSPSSGAWWPEDYANAVYALLPDNNAKQICVWNPGCGKGQESYSLACLLAKRYPQAKVRIYAQDIDLLNVSNAPLMTVPDDAARSWYAPYLTKTANGSATFSQAIKDSIMFEYHDLTNTNAFPDIDMVFTRDTLSLVDDKALEGVIRDIDEKLKGNGIIVLGQNEALPAQSFDENEVGTLRVYGKK